MGSSDTLLKVGTRPARAEIEAGPKIGLAQWLAVLAVPLLFVQAWVWIAWLRTGPEALTRYRDTSDISWPLAWAFQLAALTLLVVLGAWVVRGCLRQRRLTFDAQLCIAGALTFWTDPLANFSMPVYTYSSNWLNVNDWLGQVPFVRNPDAGRLPEPIAFLLPMYIVGWLLAALLVDRAMRWSKRRYPGRSTTRALGAGALVALAAEVALEFPMFHYGLWSYQGTPRVGLFADTGRLYPFVEMAIGLLAFLVLGLLRHSKNDRGESITERGLSGHSPGRKALVSVLALTTVFNVLWISMAGAWNFLGLYSGQWQDMKPSVHNGVCDTVGIHGTRYGPCPGTPGFRLPLPGSLPGSKPNGEDRYLNGPTQCGGCPPFSLGRSSD